MPNSAKEQLTFSADFKSVILISEFEAEPQTWNLDGLHSSICIHFENGKYTIEYGTGFEQVSQQFSIGNGSKIRFGNTATLTGSGYLIHEEGKKAVFGKVKYDLSKCTIVIKYESGPFPIHVWVKDGNYSIEMQELSKLG